MLGMNTLGNKWMSQKVATVGLPDPSLGDYLKQYFNFDTVYNSTGGTWASGDYYVADTASGTTPYPLYNSLNPLVAYPFRGVTTTATANTNGLYTYYKFNSSGTIKFTNPTNLGLQILCVGGGGGGGSSKSKHGGGGGGGKMIDFSSNSVLNTTTTLTITVGAGGASNTSGVNTTVSGGITLTAIGGGYGGSSSGANGGSGGSGGGGMSGTNTTIGAGGMSDSKGAGYYGNNGGAGGYNITSGGGGGGAGSNGADGNSNGGGGAGKATLLPGLNEITTMFAAGGSGYGSGAGTAGTANTGNGGGGAYTTSTTIVSNGGSGGSGIVIIAYLTPSKWKTNSIYNKNGGWRNTTNNYTFPVTGLSFTFWIFMISQSPYSYAGVFGYADSDGTETKSVALRMVGNGGGYSAPYSINLCVDDNTTTTIGGGTTVTGGTLNANQWYHIAWTISPAEYGATATHNVYLNNVNIYTNTELKYPSNYSRVYQDLCSMAGNGSNEMYLDTFRHYTKCLTAADVNYIYETLDPNNTKS